VGKVGVAIDSLADMRLLLADLPLDKVTTSMTINATAAILLLLYQLVAEEQGVTRRDQARRHHPERHPEGVRGPGHLHLPAPAVDAARHRHLRLLRREPAQLEHHLHLRLPHPRGRLDGGPGDRLHHRQRDRLRRGGGGGRPRRRRLRPPAQLLLERPQQPVRGGGQVPGRPADVGPDHDRALRGQGRAVQAAAVPHPDRGLDAHRAAAGEQHRPGHGPGPRRRARGDPEPAHQRLRRGPRAADRARRPRSPCGPSRSSATSRGWPTPSTPWPARTSSSR
jgi:hypothetical protein